MFFSHTLRNSTKIQSAPPTTRWCFRRALVFTFHFHVSPLSARFRSQLFGKLAPWAAVQVHQVVRWATSRVTRVTKKFQNVGLSCIELDEMNQKIPRLDWTVPRYQLSGEFRTWKKIGNLKVMIHGMIQKLNGKVCHLLLNYHHVDRIMMRTWRSYGISGKSCRKIPANSLMIALQIHLYHKIKAFNF